MKLIGAAAIVAAALGGCGHRATHHPAPADGACRGAVVAVDYGERLGCDVHRGQRLDVHYGDRPWAVWMNVDCDDSGGLLGQRADGELVCQGVDF